MRIFGKSKAPEPEVIYPLPEPVARRPTELTEERFVEQLHYAVGEISVLIQDYTRRSNDLLALAQIHKPPSRALQDEANSAFEYFAERIKHWNETYEWQFGSFIAPTEELAAVHKALTHWMVSWRDGAYCALAAKMYYARNDTINGAVFEFRSGQCMKQQAEAVEDFFFELDKSEIFDTGLVQTLGLPEWLISSMALELSTEMPHQEILDSYPGVFASYPDTEEMLDQLANTGEPVR